MATRNKPVARLYEFSNTTYEGNGIQLAYELNKLLYDIKIVITL